MPNRHIGEDHFARLGGVHFVNKVPPEEINQFVRELPEDRRETFFELFNELEQAGLIHLVNDHVFADDEGKIGGSDDC